MEEAQQVAGRQPSKNGNVEQLEVSCFVGGLYSDRGVRLSVRSAIIVIRSRPRENAFTAFVFVLLLSCDVPWPV